MAIPALQAFIGLTGPAQSQDGNTPAVRLGRSAEVITSDAHGRYYESTYRKAMYSGSITGQVTTVGTATTYTGLCLSNPNGSGINLVVNKVGVAFLVAFAAAAGVGLMTGWSATNVTHTAAVTPRSQFFTGSGGGVGLLDNSATLPVTPTVNVIFGVGLTGAITTAPSISDIYDMEGSLILPPGGFAAIYTSTASGTASMSASFQWEEVLA